MPTLTYEIQTRCFNCGEIQNTKMMRNHSLIPYDPVKRESSHYLRLKTKRDRTILSQYKYIDKRCDNCREAQLIPLHLWDASVRRVYEKA